MGEDPSGKELARTDAPRRPWRANPVLGLALCVAGSLTAAFVSGPGVGLMVAGIWLLRRPEVSHGWWAAVACILPCIAMCVVSWEAFGSLCLPWVACALLVGFVLPGRIGVTSVVCVIAVSSALMAACDAVVVASYDMSLPEYARQALDAARQQAEGALQGTQGEGSLSASAALDQSFSAMEMVWPVSYAAQGCLATLCGLLGLALARRDRYRRVYDAFLRYDVPLWGIVALVCALALLAVSNTGLPVAGTCASAALCLLIVLRVLYFLQGMAAGMAVMEARGTGAFARVLVCTALLLAEAYLFATCVLGVLDTWANVRHLPRTRKGVPEGVGTGE